MSRRTITFVITAALAVSVVLLNPHSSSAGHGGGGGGGYGGRGGFGGYGGWHGGYGYGGFYRGYGFGYGFGFGLGIGLGGYGYLPYGYGGYGYGNYIPYDVGYAGYDQPAAPVDTAMNGDPAAPASTKQQEPDNLAHLQLVLPANAEVWFAGTKMNRIEGTEQEFVSPALTPGKRFSYAIRVRYTPAGGKEIDETRTIYVRAGDRWRVDFTKPAPRQRETLPAPKADNP